MKRFFERIRAKSGDVTQPPLLIVAFGDSITQGAMEKDRFDPEGVYHRLLQRKLEEAHPLATFSTLNAGVSGSTALQAAERLERDVIRHQPDLVLIAFGLNDSGGGLEQLPAFTRTIRNFIREIRARTEADIVLLTPPFMATRTNPRIHPEHVVWAEGIIRSQTGGNLARYAEALRGIAREERVSLADIQEAWTALARVGTATDDWLINGLNHPDRRGHLLAADLLFSVIAAAAPSAQKE